MVNVDNSLLVGRIEFDKDEVYLDRSINLILSSGILYNSSFKFLTRFYSCKEILSVNIVNVRNILDLDECSRIVKTKKKMNRRI